MSEYTKGPWEVSSHDSRRFGIPRGNGLEPVGMSHIAESAAHIVKCVNCHDELLEALKQAVGDELESEEAWWAWMDKALAAIAKATGE